MVFDKIKTTGTFCFADLTFLGEYISKDPCKKPGTANLFIHEYGITPWTVLLLFRQNKEQYVL